MSSFHTSFDINVVSLDGRNSRGFTNAKGTVEGINIQTPGSIILSKTTVSLAAGLIVIYRRHKFVFDISEYERRFRFSGVGLQ